MGGVGVVLQGQAGSNGGSSPIHLHLEAISFRSLNYRTSASLPSRKRDQQKMEEKTGDVRPFGTLTVWIPSNCGKQENEKQSKTLAR